MAISIRHIIMNRNLFCHLGRVNFRTVKAHQESWQDENGAIEATYVADESENRV